MKVMITDIYNKINWLVDVLIKHTGFTGLTEDWYKTLVSLNAKTRVTELPPRIIGCVCAWYPTIAVMLFSSLKTGPIPLKRWKSWSHMLYLFDKETISDTDCTLPPFSWALSMMPLTSSAYAVAGSGWSALYLPLYTSGLGAWGGRKTLQWLLEQMSHVHLYGGFGVSRPPLQTAKTWFLIKIEWGF